MKNTTNKKINLNINTLLDPSGLEKQTPKSTYASNHIQRKVSSNSTASPNKKYTPITNNNNLPSSTISKSVNLDDKYSFSKAVMRSNSKNGISKRKPEIESDQKYSSGVINQNVQNMQNNNVSNSVFSPKNNAIKQNQNNNALNNKNYVNNIKFQSLSTRNNNLINNMKSQNIEKDSQNNNQHTNSNSISQQTLTPQNVSSNTNTNGMEMISVMNLLGNQNNSPLTVRNLSFNVNNYENSKCSVKSMQIIKAYGANTHQGIIRYEYICF